MTNDLLRRVHEHKTGVNAGFTSRYLMTRLVYFESGDDIRAAIEREKYLKGWRRSRKLELIKTMNPKWLDLSEDWYTDGLKLESLSAEDQILRSTQNDTRERSAISGRGPTKRVVDG